MVVKLAKIEKMEGKTAERPTCPPMRSFVIMALIQAQSVPLIVSGLLGEGISIIL